MEPWRKVWREGFAKVLTRPQLEALRDAVASDDPRLVQGRTTKPVYLTGSINLPVEGACAIGLCGWVGNGLQDVDQIEVFFGHICQTAWRLSGMTPGNFTRWFDETPRDQMRLELIEELNLILDTKEPHDGANRSRPAGAGLAPAICRDPDAEATAAG